MAEIFSNVFAGPVRIFHLVFKTYFIFEIACVVAVVFMVFCFFLDWYHGGRRRLFFFFSIAHIIFFSSLSCVSLSLVCLVWLQDALRVDGALPLVVAALTAHQGHAGVAEQACWALCRLAYGNAANQVPSMGEEETTQLVVEG